MRAVKLTRKQKMMVKGAKLNPENWLAAVEDDSKLVIRHKISGKERAILKNHKK